MNSIRIEKLNLAKLQAYINKLLPMSDFIAMDINESTVSSTAYLPEKNGVKTHSVDTSEIFETDSLKNMNLKMCFYDGTSVNNVLKLFIGAQVSANISFVETSGETIATKISIISEELNIDIRCADPTLGLEEMTSDQIKAVFSENGTIFRFQAQPFQISKLESLFNIERQVETFDIELNSEGVFFKGDSYSYAVVNDVRSEDGDVKSIKFYKKFVKLFDTETYEICVSDNKALLISQDSNTMLTIAAIKE